MSLMEQKMDVGSPAKAGPGNVEKQIQEKLAEKCAALEAELGLEEEKLKHFAKPEERFFTKDQRHHTTILYGGLTWKHERLIHGVLEGLGYKAMNIPTADVEAFQLGKEYGNNGQCNPTYFTVGNLVQYLQGLERNGESREEIIDNYVFLTAGACGPCRFGMYEAEYRLALRNSGFDGFRVLLFSQTGGLSQSELEAGLELNPEFFLGLLNAFCIGDQLNDVAYQVRPYEVNEGDTDRVLKDCVEEMREVLKKGAVYAPDGRIAKFLAKFPSIQGKAKLAGQFYRQLLGEDYVQALQRAGAHFNEVEVDRTRPKPIVKITGEFWAQTTEGDGNFNMFEFLQREGAQVMVEPIGTWLTYVIRQSKRKMEDRAGLDEEREKLDWWRLGAKATCLYKDYRPLVLLTVVEKLFSREWQRLRKALSDVPHDLCNQYELQRLGDPFYSTKAGGGEGYMEVAKNIYYHNKDLAHMVLGLKPFGCMPSTQSDGAQSAVINNFKDIIYLPIETSGEGEINAHSRVQMALGEAKTKCKGEFARTLDEWGISTSEIEAYVTEHPELKKGLYVVPHTKGHIGTAANFAAHIAQLMGRERTSAVEEDSAPSATTKIDDLNKELVVINQN